MRTKELVTRVIYVRHGKTDFPLDRIYCDEREDPSLNPLGIEQVGRASSLLADMPLKAIYSSPSLRTQMTARIIAERHGFEVQTKSEWVERRFGIWEGLFFHEIEESYPQEYLNWKRDNSGFSPVGGETIFDLYNRIQPSLTQMIDAHKGDVIAVVSHVGPIRTVLASALGMELARYRSLTIDYASVSIVDYGRSQNNLICMNR